MQMNKNIYLLSLLVILSIGFVMAIDNTAQLNNNTNITVVCINDGFCSDSAECIINIVSPNNIIELSNQSMTNYGSFFAYNYTFNNIGDYDISGYCVDDSFYGTIDYKIKVTQTGEDYDVSSKNSSFVLAMGLIIILSLFLSWLAFKMESNIIKIGILSFSILLMIFNIGFTLNILEDVVGVQNQIYSSFATLYTVAMYLSVALAIGLIIWMIVIGLNVYKMKRGIGDGFD